VVGVPDPMGKRALYWLPVDEQAAVGDDGPPSTAGRASSRAQGAGRHARPQGKRALFSEATPASTEEPASPIAGGPVPSRGLLVVNCSSCGSVSRVGLFEFALLQLPIWGWIPGRTFDRWMTCAACHRRTWNSVTLAR